MGVDLAELLRTQESCELEFKRTAKDRNAIRQAICALALFNNKGGVGKTTLTYHLAHMLQRLRHADGAIGSTSNTCRSASKISAA